MSGTITLPATADFEVGTNGSIVDKLDTGSATAWSDDTDLQTYSSTQAHSGSLSCLTDSGGFVTWQLATALTETWARFYVYLTANPGSTVQIARFTDSLGAQSAQIWVTSTGKLFIRDNNGTKSATTTNSISLNQWVRIEVHLTSSATTGAMEAKLFNTTESDTATETVSFSAADTKADVLKFLIGNINGSLNYWVDDIEWNATGYPGPKSAPSATGAVSQAFTFGAVTSGFVPGVGGSPAARLGMLGVG